MPDSESLAESFLTAFPSIIPLSAHGILSCGCIFFEFLEWSHDRRMHAVQKYKIPEESVSLFDLLCQYGEREDSKSGMTDSSSSVSYAPDRFQLKSNTEAKKRKQIDNMHAVDVNKNELSQFEPISQFSDIQLDPSRLSASGNFWMLESLEIDEHEKLGVSLDDKFLGQSWKLNANIMRNSSKESPPYGFEMAEGSPTSADRKKPKKPRNNGYLFSNQGADMAVANKQYWYGQEKSGNQLEDLIGEVIDTDVCATFGKDISMLNSLSFSPHEVDKDSGSGISGTKRKLSYTARNFSTSLTPTEIESNSDDRICKSNSENSPRKANQNAPASCFNNFEFHSKHRKGLLLNDKLQKTALDSNDLTVQKEDGDHSNGTLLWNAVHSSRSQPLRESPWTIEFLKSCLYKNQKVSDSILPAWTPIDKRAKRTLSFATMGNGGQSKLI